MGAEKTIRRGLPRVPGGEPWPAVGVQAQPVAQPVAEAAAAAPAVATASPTTPAAPETTSAPAPAVTDSVLPAPAPGATVAAAETDQPMTDTAVTDIAGTVEVALRQGLPRTPGGEPWPAAGVAHVRQREAAPTAVTQVAPEAAPVEAAPPSEGPRYATPEEAPAEVARQSSAPQPSAEKPASAATPQAAPAPKPRPEPRRYRGRTVAGWVGTLALWAAGIIAAAGVIVLAARGVTTLPGVPEFLERYPGEYHSRFETDDGFPAWARWTHFLNFFFIILIIRSGLLVRTQQQPDAFYTPKRGGKKVSIYLWMHTSLDVLWLVNGIVFVILIFVTGHWARIVPTSWEVFPNAVSAMLQYLTLEWPAENGWVNYNSLQQLMYFTVVFIAAPLAAITGARLSEWWPQKAERLNRIYPAPLARAIHFPTMLFFSLFIVIHVFLVLATGALRNLNHMFAGTDTVSWAGFWWFAIGLVVTVGLTVAARPLVLAPIAGISGRVSNR